VKEPVFSKFYVQCEKYFDVELTDQDIIVGIPSQKSCHFPGRNGVQNAC
jgi:hypothetical protein